MKAALLFVALSLGTAMPLEGGFRADGEAGLTVRIYDAVGLAPAEIAAAHRVAASIFRDAGLHVRLRHCGRAMLPDVPVESCEQPLAGSEVVVRLIAAPMAHPSLHPNAFGVTYILDGARRSWLATVFPARIRGAALRAGVEPGTLVGRVIAHEVGHLLLGGSSHGAAGVMRPRWLDGWIAADADAWRFSPAEALRMHLALVPPL